VPEFERYWPLALLLVAVPLLIAGRPRPWLRALAVLLLILAACGPSLPIGVQPRMLVIVIDASRSTLWRDSAAFGPPDWAPIVPSGAYPLSAEVHFGRVPAVELSPWDVESRKSLGESRSKVDGSATDVERALDLALGLCPPEMVPTVLLRTDGQETQRDARRAIARLRARGGRLFCAPLDPKSADLRVAAISAPTEVAEGEPVHVEVTLAATGERSANVALYAEEALVGERKDVDVSPTREARVAFSLLSLSTPVLTLQVRVTSDHADPWPENDAAWAVVRRAGKPRVLMVAEPGRRLEQVLRASGGFDVRASTSIEALHGYDAVVLDDRPAEGLPDFGDYVRESRGGLLVAGGPRSFGPGGYAGTPLEDLLPVWCLPKEAFSLVVLLDASGSMAEGTTGATKYDTALLALEAVRDLLRPGDRVELVRFSGVVAAVAMADAAAFPSQIAAARGAPPSGSTALVPALEKGVGDLEAESSPRRHLLVITDGELAPGEVGSPSFASFAERLSRAGAACTVLTTGTRPAEAELRALGGRYLPLARLEDLPRTLREDLVQARRLVEERAEAPKRAAGEPLLPGVDRCPPVGRNRVTTKEGARADFAFEDGSPLYAGWQAGLGRVVAAATTLEAPWGDRWSVDTEAARLWVEAVRWALRPPGRAGISWEVRGDRLEVAVPGPFRRLTARIVPAGGKPVDVLLDPVGRERYVGALSDLPPGIGGIEVREGDAALASGALALPGGPEFRVLGVDRARLEEWARLGGGRVLDRDVPDPPEGSRGAPWPVGPVGAGLGVVLLFADALRRRQAA